MSKICIREGVFETNSSSMHSIAVRKKSGLHSSIEDTNKRHSQLKSIHKEYFFSDDISFDRFPFRILASIFDKARYAIASMAEYINIREGEEWTTPSPVKDVYDIIRKYIPDFLGFDYKKEWDSDYLYLGAVDHQSQGLLENFLKNNNISLEEFLTDSKYVVFIDGDEYYYLDSFLKEGLIHEEDFEKIVTA